MILISKIFILVFFDFLHPKFQIPCSSVLTKTWSFSLWCTNYDGPTALVIFWRCCRKNSKQTFCCYFLTASRENTSFRRQQPYQVLPWYYRVKQQNFVPFFLCRAITNFYLSVTSFSWKLYFPRKHLFCRPVLINQSHFLHKNQLLGAFILGWRKSMKT